MRPWHIGIIGSVVVLCGCAHRTALEPASTPAPASLTFAAPIPPIRGEPHTAFALRYIDVAVGAGQTALPRQCVYVHYTGWLTDGTKFDSSRDTLPNGAPRPPYAVALGMRRVIAGWDEGFAGMAVGGRRRLLIPYQLAYGELGRPPVIPPRAELIFDVELMAVADTMPRPAATPGPAARCPAWSDVTRASTP